MANVDQKNLIPLCILEVLHKYSDEDHLLTHNMMSKGANLLKSRGFENTSVFNEGGIVPLPNGARR